MPQCLYSYIRNSLLEHAQRNSHYRLLAHKQVLSIGSPSKPSFFLQLSVLGKPNLHLAHDPCAHENAHHAAKDDERLPQRYRGRDVVGDDEIAVAELVNQVASLDVNGCTPNGVEVGLV